MQTRFASAVAALGFLLFTCDTTPSFAQKADATACSAPDANAAIPACTRLLAQSLPMQARGAAYGFRGRAYYLKGDYDRAIHDFDDALRLNPKDVASYGLRGAAYFGKGDFDAAIRDLDEAIRLNPKIVRDYLNRSAAYGRKGDFDRAIRDLEEVLRLDPTNAPGVLSVRGTLYSMMRDHDRALRDFDEAVRLNPRAADAYTGRSIVYVQKGDYERAIRDLDAAIRLNPANVTSYISRSVAYIRTGDYDSAIRDLNEAIRLDPKNTAAYGNRGAAYRQKGEFDQAIRDLDEAIRLDPKNARAYFHRAVSYEKTGNLGQAYRDIVEALALNPSDAEAAAEQQTLRSLLSAVPSVGGAPAAATPVQPAGSRIALVIGNSKYRFAPELTNPQNDAHDIAAALGELGFRVIEGYDLDGAGMRARIAEFGSAMPGSATTLLFYAGHGLQVAGKNYLVPVDAKLERPSALGVEAIELDNILADMETEKRTNLVFLDACRDNPLSRSLSRSFGGTRSATVGQGLAQLNAGIGSLITFSTSPNTVALDGSGRNSPFTAALLKHIRTPDIEVRTMLTRVRADVVKATNERQLPWDHSSLLGEFYFKRGG
jgi:tetratricopeptide (TPR) repeat protein